MLGKIQKEILKLLPLVMCKNHMKLKLVGKVGEVGKAMSILQQPGMELFENFFLDVA